jgi:hypothetical protein
MISAIVTRTLKLKNCWIQDSIKKDREKKEKNPRDTRNFYEDTISIVEKILTRRIQRYQRRSPMMIGVSHTNNSKVSEHWYILTTVIAYFVHCLWYFCVIGFVLLRFFQQYQWRCRHWSFDMPQMSFSLSLSSLLQHLFPFFYWILCLIIF